MVRDSEHGHRLRRVLISVGILVALLVADGAYAGLTFRSRFKQAACDLKRATDLVSELEIDEATERLEESIDGTRSSRTLLGHPAVRLASLIPWAGDSISALRELTHVAEEASLAGLAGTRAATSMGLSEEGSLASLYSDGRVRFEGVEEGSEALRVALGHLGKASRHLDEAKGAPLGQVRSAVSGARRIVERAIEDLGHAEGLLGALPGLLGQRGPRRYFLAFHAPSEARGGGGLIGVYGLLDASEGRLELAHVGPIRDLVPKLRRPVTAPSWFRKLYENLDGLEGWREANQSPNFPVVSEVLLRMYEASTGDRLDGVIAMDPLVLQELTRATGPISAPGVDEPVGPDNAARILMRDIYLGFERREDEQNRFLKSLVDRLYAKLASGDVDGQELADAIGGSIRTRHLKMYSTVAPEQAALRDSGVAGDPEIFGSNVQMLFHNNFAANKIDWYLQRTQDVTIAIQPDGSARVITTLELENGAPRGQKSLLKKSDVNEYPAGLNILSAHFMLPEDARVEAYYLNDGETTYFEGREAGRYPVAWSPLQIPVQDTASVSVSYVVPELVSLEGSRRFRFTFIPQALVRPDIFELEIFAPEGYVIGRDEPGAPMSSSLQISGLLKAPKELELRVLPAGTEPPDETDLDGACS